MFRTALWQAPRFFGPLVPGKKYQRPIGGLLQESSYSRLLVDNGIMTSPSADVSYSRGQHMTVYCQQHDFHISRLYMTKGWDKCEDRKVIESHEQNLPGVGGVHHTERSNFRPLSSFIEVIGPLTHALDTRISGKVAYVIIPIIVVSALWLGFNLADYDKGINWLQKHFACNLHNLEEGRLYTLLTSCIASGGNFYGGAIGEICAWLLFGSNFIRSFGLRKTLAFYLSGHLSVSAIGIYYNWKHARQLEQYAKWLQGSDGSTAPCSLRSERGEMVFNIERTQARFVVNPKQYESPQLKILRMSDQEFILYAIDYYKNNNTISVGGGLLISALGVRLYPTGLIPIPYIALPVLFFVPAQFWFALNSFPSYPPENAWTMIAPSIFLPFAFALLIKTKQLHRNLPGEIVQEMKMCKWVPRVMSNNGSSISAKPKIQNEQELVSRMKMVISPTSGISEQSLQAMRKRNQKYQAAKHAREVKG